MKKSLLAITLLTTSVFSAAAMADVTKAPEFIQKAAIAGKFEIDSSKLALKKSSDADVKAFAQKMIDDHTKADKELKAAIADAKLDAAMAPKELDEKHQKIIDKLEAADAKDFDKDYIDAQEDAHDDAVDLFEDYAEKGDNEQLKAFAAKTLPTLKSHHEKVDALDDTHDDDNHAGDHKTGATTEDKAADHK